MPLASHTVVLQITTPGFTILDAIVLYAIPVLHTVHTIQIQCNKFELSPTEYARSSGPGRSQG